MKKWLAGLLLLAGLLAMAGCGGTRLQITNASTVYLEDVAWSDTYFGEMYPGDSITKPVTAGTDSIYMIIGGGWYGTEDLITVEEGLKTSYTLYDDTWIFPLASGMKALDKRVKLGDLRKP